ncbi:MAG: thioredoxin family protein [Dehalococcoidia bacterium]|nr:thioredoxin family protein [Dehalococcoidia bacterium]
MPTIGQPIEGITADRFAQGLTFEAYLDDIATPENLAREGSDGATRSDQSGWMRQWYAGLALTDAQAASMRDLASRPDGPAHVLVISEEWSSDCRRDVPVVARLAEAGGLDLRVFNRDGQRFGATPLPDPALSPNADLMAPFVNTKRSETYQSIPVAAFFTSDWRYLYHFVEHAAVYDKDAWVYGHLRVPRPGETTEETGARIGRGMGELIASPFFRVWASATADEIISALYGVATLGLASTSAPSGGS